MANFDEMLAALHGDGMGGALSDIVGADQAPKIIVTAARAFEFDKGFDKVIAYEGDVNSQIITFILPESHEGHLLSECGNKKVRWINQASKVEGTSVLTPRAEANEYEWNVPPALFTKSGTIEFSIVVYDLDADDKIGFSWNTAPCTALSVGKSIESVGGIGNMPAQNEILIINEDSRTIIAPAGYNTTIANSGDKNTSVVYFQTKRYIKGIDLTEHTAAAPVVYISYVLDDGGKRSTGGGSIEVVPYTSQYDGITNELVLIIWRPEAGLTAGSLFYGSFQTLVSFKKNEKVWNSAPYNGLRIGKPLDYTDNPGGTLTPQLSYKFLGKDYSNKGDAVEISAIIAHQVRTAVEWQELGYIPEDGEVVYVVNNGAYFSRIGNGKDSVINLPNVSSDGYDDTFILSEIDRLSLALNDFHTDLSNEINSVDQDLTEQISLRPTEEEVDNKIQKSANRLEKRITALETSKPENAFIYDYEPAIIKDIPKNVAMYAEIREINGKTVKSSGEIDGDFYHSKVTGIQIEGSNMLPYPYP
jgi:hypothetical protein